MRNFESRMSSIRLEKVREDSVLTNQQIISKLMTCPYLEEELAGVYERGVRLSVERLAKNSKIPKTILFTNAALEKEMRKQTVLLESAKRHRTNIVSWTQRQFFIRHVFDGQNNFRFATSEKHSLINTPMVPSDDRDAENCGEIVPMSTKTVATRPATTKGFQRVPSAPLYNGSNKSSGSRLAFSAPVARSRQSSGRMSAHTNLPITPEPRLRRAVSVMSREEQMPPWYSCLATKPWMLESDKQTIRKRNKSGRSVRTGYRHSSTIISTYSLEDSPDFRKACPDSEIQTDLDVFLNSKIPCSSMRKWCTPANRAILSRILPSLPQTAFRNILQLFGEDIEEQKRMLHELAKSTATKNALKDKRWVNLECSLKSLQNEK